MLIGLRQPLQTWIEIYYEKAIQLVHIILVKVIKIAAQFQGEREFSSTVGQYDKKSISVQGMADF